MSFLNVFRCGLAQKILCTFCTQLESKKPHKEKKAVSEITLTMYLTVLPEVTLTPDLEQGAFLSSDESELHRSVNVQLWFKNAPTNLFPAIVFLCIISWKCSVITDE